MRGWDLAADSQSLDELLIARPILVSHVLEQTGPLPHHLQEAAPRGVILLVQFEVLREVADLLRENGHLHLGRARIAVVRAVLADDLVLVLDRNG